MARKKQQSGRMNFPGMDATAFQHTSDREAMKKLSRLPGMPTILRKLSGSYIEKTVRMLNVSQHIRVSAKQYPSVHQKVKEACNILDIKEMPEVFVANHWSPNAFSFGIEKHTVVLLTGLVDSLDDEELLYVIGHELSHIKCGHMMYRTLLHVLTFIGVEVFGVLFKVAAITFFPIEMALRSWERRAELTCDRGGLLVVQNRDVVHRAMIKMSGASRSLLKEINIKEVLKQADELRNMDDEKFLRAMKMYHTAFKSHPFPITRMKEIQNWSESDQYKRILAGKYPGAKAPNP